MKIKTLKKTCKCSALQYQILKYNLILSKNMQANPFHYNANLLPPFTWEYKHVSQTTFIFLIFRTCFRIYLYVHGHFAFMYVYIHECLVSADARRLYWVP